MAWVGRISDLRLSSDRPYMSTTETKSFAVSPAENDSPPETADGAEPIRCPVAPGEVVGDKYRVDKVLAAGGMGVVVAAWHLKLDEQVAIKFLREEALDDAEI